MNPTKPDYPATPVQMVTETLHGVEIGDPYRWLEESESPVVQAWTAAQNACTRAWLNAHPQRAILRQRLAALARVGFVQAPVRRGDRYFFTTRQGDDNQAKLMLREGTAERVLIDPAQLAADGAVALDWWFPSRDGALVAYGLSSGGDERSTLRVLKVATGHELPGAIDRTRYTSLAWLPDASGFYYTRNPAPGSVPAGEENYHKEVFLHRLGDDPAQDEFVYADADMEAIPEVRLSRDGRFLMLEIAHGWSVTVLLWRDLADPAGNFLNLTPDSRHLFTTTDDGVTLFIHTNWGAPKFRALRAPLVTPDRRHWQEIIPEGDHALTHLALTGDTLVGNTLENAISHLRLFDKQGAPQGEIPLPAAGTAYGPANNPDAAEALFAFTSFVYPITAYRYAIPARRLEVFGAPQTPAGFDPASILVEQVWYPSADGALVSMFIAWRRNVPLDGQRPTILTGYGGFNISRTPEFNTGVLAWLERGGVYALANLRGGAEYGERWHQAGMLGNKQHTFDDFLAAAEWLVANNVCQPCALGCWGGSNGGLLVGAAITQRPDLFQAAVCMVPLLDMLRYHHFQIARLWIPEYGSSEDPEQFAWLRAYSPYHHVRPGVDYPATLLTAGEGDSRVDPLHARKMAALLQADTSGDRPILLRVEARAGHGQGKPVTKVIEEQADLWTFMAVELGLQAQA